MNKTNLKPVQQDEETQRQRRNALARQRYRRRRLLARKFAREYPFADITRREVERYPWADLEFDNLR
jgi:hypothetical protein